jgi:hypothetical protein
MKIKSEENEELNFEIEIEDDTPEEDRDKEPMPDEIVQSLEDDELEEFSKEKAKQLKKVWHDERRRAEGALREREEAVQVARRLFQENRQLKQSLSTGERALVGTAKQSAERELEIAKRAYKDAYDSGDADQVVDAQEKLVTAKLQMQQVETYRPQFEDDEEALQPTKKRVNRQAEDGWSVASDEAPLPKPDAKALAWQKRNAWFGENRVMTSMAFGLHESLVGKGYDPTSDEYYVAIDKEIRKRFPEEFEDDPTPTEKRRNPSSVVTPAKRTVGTNRVRLKASQVAIAKRLGLTPEQYAAELVRMGELNG